MNRFSYVFAGLIAAVSLVWTSQSLLAQGVTVQPDEETSAILGTMDVHIFHVTVRNDGFFPLTFYVMRSLNELPTDEWMSAICMDSYCYDRATDRTDAVTIQPGGAYGVKLNVWSGGAEDQSGRFVLKFITDGVSGVEFGEIEFLARTGSSSGVPQIVEPGHLPFPNPAISDVTIPLNAVPDAQRAEVYNVTGAQVALFNAEEIATNSELRLNVEDFMPGLYYYKITGTDEARSGSFTVVK